VLQSSCQEDFAGSNSIFDGPPQSFQSCAYFNPGNGNNVANNFPTYAEAHQIQETQNYPQTSQQNPNHYSQNVQQFDSMEYFQDGAINNAPCQGPQPWNYAYCYGFYGDPPCHFADVTDMEDFM
jgi:hypothetical protein